MSDTIPDTEKVLHLRIAQLQIAAKQNEQMYNELRLRFAQSGKLLLAIVKHYGEDGKLPIKSEHVEGVEKGQMLDMDVTDEGFHVLSIVSASEAKRRMRELEADAHNAEQEKKAKLELVKEQEDADSDTRVDTDEPASEDGVDV